MYFVGKHVKEIYQFKNIIIFKITMPFGSTHVDLSVIVTMHFFS